MIKDAILSGDKRHRFVLTRDWHPASRPFPTTLGIIMLNPSMADANVDDPTIRKCMGFADRNLCDAITVLNLFTLRSTKPKTPSAWGTSDLGFNADIYWDMLDNYQVLCAWGAGAPDWRVRFVLNQLGKGRILYCLGTTATGAPRHPLYVPYTQKLERWKP